MNDCCTPRHIEVLLTATELIAERGLKAASLRELARRLNMSQPSLYHYFESKDDLVRQIIEYQCSLVFPESHALPPLRTIEELVEGSFQYILALYSSDAYVNFVRFVFTICLERRDWLDLIRVRFIEASRAPMRELAAPLIKDGLLFDDDLDHLNSLLTGPLILQLVDYRVLLREDFELTRWLPETSFFTEVITAGLHARTKRRTLLETPS